MARYGLNQYGDKPIQHSAFLIEYRMYHCEKKEGGPAESRSHSYPLLILDNWKDAISFMTRYTRFGEYNNNDILQMKAELKEVNCGYDILDMDLFDKEIRCDDYYNELSWFRTYYSEHSIGIQILPKGIYKKHLMTNFILTEGGFNGR